MYYGIPIDKIISWRKEHGNIFHVEIGGTSYFFRALKKNEYDLLLKMVSMSSVEAEDALLSMALLSPKFDAKKFDEKLAGEVESLIECVNSVSGFSSTDNILKDIESARSDLGSLENQIAIMICKAFPHLTLESINHLTYKELIRYLAISEVILDMKLNIEKPDKQPNGPIDFGKENSVMGGPDPFSNPFGTKSRGDVGK